MSTYPDTPFTLVGLQDLKVEIRLVSILFSNYIKHTVYINYTFCVINLYCVQDRVKLLLILRTADQVLVAPGTEIY